MEGHVLSPGARAVTSDGISKEDWDRVHELAVELVNTDDEAEEEEVRTRLFALLDDLTEAYGELPNLVATRADYVDDPDESERLLLRGFDLAVARTDALNIRMIALSLAALYARDLLDDVSAIRWAEIAHAHLDPTDESEKAEYERVLAAIEKLKNDDSKGK